MLYREQGKVSEAIQLLNNSLAIKEKVFGHDQPSVSSVATFFMWTSYLCCGGVRTEVFC